MTKPIKPTLKRRVVRWLDNISRQIRARLEEKSETHAFGNPPTPGSPISDLVLTEVSLVGRCPYCGSEDWNTPKTKPDGTVCDHPTRLRVIK